LKLPAFLKALTDDPRKLRLWVKKLVRVGMFLGLTLGGMIYFKRERDAQEKDLREKDERKQLQADEQKVKQEINWEEQVKIILPDQEELLTPNVVPQLILPPLLDKIQVPDALVYERKKRYIAAYEFKKTPAVSFWNESASAAGLDVSRFVAVDLPAIPTPLFKEVTPVRKPKPAKGVGQTYILLP